MNMNKRPRTIAEILQDVIWSYENKNTNIKLHSYTPEENIIREMFVAQLVDNPHRNIAIRRLKNQYNLNGGRSRKIRTRKSRRSRKRTK